MGNLFARETKNELRKKKLSHHYLSDYPTANGFRFADPTTARLHITYAESKTKRVMRAVGGNVNFLPRQHQHKNTHLLVYSF